MSGRVAGKDQRNSREGALKAITLEAAYSLRLENEVGSIVPGKLANFTILADNPVTCDAAKIKNIPVWGTVHEGRILPVQNQKKAHAGYGPVPNEATLMAMKLDALAHAQGEEQMGDICTLNHRIAAIIAKRL